MTVTSSGDLVGGESISDRERELWSWQRRAALGDLAAGIARDFNNLLTAIRASCDLLLTELEARDPHHEDVAAIARTAEQATTLVRQLMTLGRERPPEIRAIDLTALVSSLEPILLRLLDRRIHLATALDPAVGTVLGDSALLEHVLLTLVLHARDAMPHGGRLTVSISRRHLSEPIAHRHGVVAAGDYGVLVVRDEGDGMDDATLDRLFDPVTGTESLGSIAGLALSSVYGVIMQTQGVVVVTRDPRGGTEVAVYLRREVMRG